MRLRPHACGAGYELTPGKGVLKIKFGSNPSLEGVAKEVDPKDIFNTARENTGADLALTGFGLSEKGIACEFGNKTDAPVRKLEPDPMAGKFPSVNVKFAGLNQQEKTVLDKIGVPFLKGGGVTLEPRSGEVMRLSLKNLDVRNFFGDNLGMGFGLKNKLATGLVGHSAENVSVDVVPKFNPTTHKVELHFVDVKSSGKSGQFATWLAEKLLHTDKGQKKVLAHSNLGNGLGIALPQQADLSKVTDSKLAVTIDVDHFLPLGEIGISQNDISGLQLKVGQDGLKASFDGAVDPSKLQSTNTEYANEAPNGFMGNFVNVSHA